MHLLDRSCSLKAPLTGLAALMIAGRLRGAAAVFQGAEVRPPLPAPRPRSANGDVHHFRPAPGCPAPPAPLARLSQWRSLI